MHAFREQFENEKNSIAHEYMHKKNRFRTIKYVIQKKKDQAFD